MLSPRLQLLRRTLPLLMLLLLLSGVRSGATKYHFRVEEEVPIGASIESSDLFEICFQLPKIAGDSVILRGLGKASADWLSSLLVVSPSGGLQVNQPIDREDSRLGCRARSPCNVSFEAQLQNLRDPQRMKLVGFDLQIVDKNDNAPQFSSEGRILTVNENSMMQQYPLPIVIDADAGDNGRTSTRIVASNVPNRTGVDKLGRAETSQPYLMVGPGLDFESFASYQLTLEACDFGLQRRCNKTTVEIRVQDANDNAPQFERKLYELEPVLEDAYVPGQPPLEVGRVRAVDLDSGENGRIRYLIDSGPDNFKVDPNTGAVQIIGKVTASGQGPVELDIIATDCGEPALSDTAKVQLRLIDVNDHSPEIVLMDIRGQIVDSKRLVVLENAVSSIFAYVRASDRDQDDNGRIDCRLGFGASNFSLGPPAHYSAILKLFSVNVIKIYDRESQASDLFEVICRDHGSPPRSSSATFQVEIGDVNEFAPKFNKTIFHSRIQEGLPPGSAVVQVVAHDRDATANLTYSFRDEGIAKGYFEVDRHTGQILTVRRLDREAVADFSSGQPVYTLSVQVSDGERTGTAQVEVAVTDVNDNAPVVSGPRLLEINETFGDSHVQNALIGQLTFEDLDDPATPNAKATFYLKSVMSTRRNLNVTFRVDASGEVWASGRLDREQSDQHLLVVSVTDFGFPKMSSSATVTVSLLDLNDNLPVVLRPLPNEVINITNDHTPGVLVLQLEVQDADQCQLPHSLSGRDCVLSGRFNMRLQQRGLMFQLDSATGSMRVLSSLSTGLHPLTVTITDSGRPEPLSTTVRFAVMVEQRQDGSMFAPSWGPSSNWTVLLVIVGASSLITVVLVVAIVMLTRRQPCVMGRGSRRGYGGPKDQQMQQQQMQQMQQRDSTDADGVGQQGFGGQQQLADGPLTTFGQSVGQQETLRRENGNGSYSLHFGQHNPGLYPPGDYDVASADSGHGASEEEMMHMTPGAIQDHGSALQTRYSILNLPGCTGTLGGQLRSRSPACNCILEEDPHPQCQERLPLTHCPGGGAGFSRPAGLGRQPLTLLSEPQFAAVSLQSPGYRSLSRPHLQPVGPYAGGSKSAAAV